MRAGSRILVAALVIGLLGAAAASAQEASVVGTIADESKAVRPGESPFVEVLPSPVAGNVNRRQMEALPLQGRNWMELSMMVKGITTNNFTNQSAVSNDDFFQLNLDGQQITQKPASSGFGQPAFSRDAIAEFQNVTSQFDITQGRSVGIQVQAISKSGSNVPSGSLHGFFRSDALNAADQVAHRVLPYSDQQVGGASGGPVIKNRLQYFASCEYERQPTTLFSAAAALPSETFNFP